MSRQKLNQMRTLVLGFIACALSAQTTTVTFSGTIPNSGPTTTQPALITPTDRALFNAKQSALTGTNKLPWIQISNIPIAGSASNGILLNTDWQKFNAKQNVLGFTPENSANKNKPNGYAGLGIDGLLPYSQLSNVPPPVPGPQGMQGVQGATGATGSIGPLGPVGPSGPAGPQGIPGPLSFGGAWKSAATYGQGTMVAFNGQSYTALIGNTGVQPDIDVVAGAGNWVLAAAGAIGQTGPMGPAGPSGPTGPQGVIGANGIAGPIGLTGPRGPIGPSGPVGVASDHTVRAAVSSAIHDNGPIINQALATCPVGGEVFLPCGTYPQSTPFILPKGVSLVGEKGCTAISGNSDFTPGVTSTYITYPGLVYTTATVTFSGGSCAIQPTGRTIVRDGEVISAFITNPGICPSTMPDCAITGDGIGASCEAVGHGQVEIAQQHARSPGTSIRNITFKEPPVSGAMGVHFQTSVAVDSAGGTSGGASVDERIEDGDFEWLRFEGSNQYNPIDLYLEGDCIRCKVDQLTSNPSRGMNFGPSSYATTLLATGICGGTGGNEECGFIYSHLRSLRAGGNRGGSVFAFQGRLVNASIEDSSANGDQGGGYANSFSFALFNSMTARLASISTEGNAGGPQILIFKTTQTVGTSIQFGTPELNNGVLPRDGLSLVASSGNIFDTHMGSYNSLLRFPAGTYAVHVDSNSHKNAFYHWGAGGGGASEFSTGDSSNYVQWFMQGSEGNTAAPWHIIGNPF